MKKIICDRCKKVLAATTDEDFTAGYYDVRNSDWTKFAHKNEKFVCDQCMWSDERYKRAYGTLLSD